MNKKQKDNLRAAMIIALAKVVLDKNIKVTRNEEKNGLEIGFSLALSPSDILWLDNLKGFSDVVLKDAAEFVNKYYKKEYDKWWETGNE